MTTEKSYLDMPAEEWDGKCMIYSQMFDRFYLSPKDALEEVRYRCSETRASPYSHELDDIRLATIGELVLTEPSFIQLSKDDFHDLTPEDGELPDKVLQAIEAFNDACKDVPVIWYPCKNRLKV